MPEPALQLERVTKRYATHLAVDDLSLSIPSGTIFGLLGPNGAGKTTTVRMAMNILGRDAGEIRVLGADPARDRRVQALVGYLPEERGLYKDMRALDAIVFFSRLKGLSKADARRRGAEWLERFDLGAWRDKKVSALSKGMQQKVQFIATVAHEPALLVLDEPFSGLDPMNQRAIRDAVLDAHRQGRTVVFSTHILEHAEDLCDHVAILARGRKVLEGATAAVRRTAGVRRYRIELEAVTHAVERLMRSDGPTSPFARVDRVGGGAAWDVELRAGCDVRALVTELNALDAPLVQLARVEPSLRDVFLARVDGDAPSGAAA